MGDESLIRALIPDVFLYAYCFHFAAALKERFPDGELVGVGVPNRNLPSHVMVRVDGVLLDVRGAITEPDLLSVSRDGVVIEPLDEEWLPRVIEGSARGLGLDATAVMARTRIAVAEMLEDVQELKTRPASLRPDTDTLRALTRTPPWKSETADLRERLACESFSIPLPERLAAMDAAARGVSPRP
jgi:hypothetical protein